MTAVEHLEEQLEQQQPFEQGEVAEYSRTQED